MQPGMKVLIAILVCALIVVVGLIVMTKGTEDGTQKPDATQTMLPAEEPAETSQIEEQTATDNLEAIPEENAEQAQTDNEQAQEVMYEGALAGMTEEEIAEMAIAEENSAERTSDNGGEDAVD